METLLNLLTHEIENAEGYLMLSRNASDDLMTALAKGSLNHARLLAYYMIEKGCMIPDGIIEKMALLELKGASEGA